MKNNKKQICIIGIGLFGSGLAKALSKKADVLVIDNCLEKVNAIADDVQKALCLNAGDYNALSAVVSDKFDEAIITIGENLESSILCALYLKRIGVQIIRAKASSQEHAEILTSLGVTHVFLPEKETAERLSSQIINPNLLDFVPLAEDYSVIELIASSELINNSLESLHLRKKYGVFIIAIKKSINPEFIFLPGPDYIIESKDILIVIGKKEGILKFSMM
jgi:trk system potassium uptake protein